MKLGGPTERAAAFRTGKIVGFPSPPGTILLAKGMPHRIMISTADFQKRYEFPYICSTTTKSYLASNRETMRKLTMALIEATHFLKTHKEDTRSSSPNTRARIIPNLEVVLRRQRKLHRSRAIGDPGRNRSADQRSAGAQCRRYFARRGHRRVDARTGKKRLHRQSL